MKKKHGSTKVKSIYKGFTIVMAFTSMKHEAFIGRFAPEIGNLVS